MLAGAGFQVLRDGAGAYDGPGEADFTPAEWAVLQQALMAAGVLVSLAEGTVDAEEMYALFRKLREASVSHTARLVRELAATSAFTTGLRADAGYDDYQGPALQLIGSAAALLARTAPGQAAGFRVFLTEVAEVVADANDEGGFFGLGARPRTPREAAVIEAIRKAAESGSRAAASPG
jgi:hypothetical protein